MLAGRRKRMKVRKRDEEGQKKKRIKVKNGGGKREKKIKTE